MELLINIIKDFLVGFGAAIAFIIFIGLFFALGAAIYYAPVTVFIIFAIFMITFIGGEIRQDIKNIKESKK
jgi:uncharacterized membrane protein